MRYSISVLLLIIMLSSFLFAQDRDRREGNWWRQQKPTEHLHYLAGFFDGMDLGNDFSCWKWSGQRDKAKTVADIRKSYVDYFNRFFSNVTAVQLADGLDRFYEDYRNRSITIRYAIWIVVNAIGGKPENELQNMIESFRRSVHLDQ